METEEQKSRPFWLTSSCVHAKGTSKGAKYRVYQILKFKKTLKDIVVDNLQDKQTAQVQRCFKKYMANLMRKDKVDKHYSHLPFSYLSRSILNHYLVFT